jgi:Zinc finger, C3HC4 type (RING finger)
MMATFLVMAIEAILLVYTYLKKRNRTWLGVHNKICTMINYYYYSFILLIIICGFTTMKLITLLVNGIYFLMRRSANGETDIGHKQLSFKLRPLKENFCLVCRDTYDTNDNYYLLKCGHAAHSDCLDSWWNKLGSKHCLYRCKT